MLQRIIQCIHQQSIRILYKTRPQLLVRLAVQPKPQNRDKEILGMNITINAIDLCKEIPDCMRVEEIR